MVQLREAAFTIRSKINTKINHAISNFRDPPPPSQSQNQHQQTPDYDEDETLSTLHRLVLARKRNTTSFSHSTGTPPPASPPNDPISNVSGTGERTTKVMESLFSTMFGVCAGTQHETCSNNGPQCPAPSMYYCDPSDNYDHRDNNYRRKHHNDVLHNMQKRNRRPPSLPSTIIQHTPTPSNQRKSFPNSNQSKTKTKNNTQQHRRQSTHPNDEYNYANFDNDDDYHAEPTTPIPATQLSIPRRKHHHHHSDGGGGIIGSKGRNHRRQKSTQRRINVITPQEAEENRIARATNAARGSNKQVRQEHINVGGMPYRLTEVARPSCDDRLPSGDGGLELEEEMKEEGTARSYSYDDGISALSAHTLEDMAERELFLDRLRGIPIEEGFDIAEDAGAGRHLEDRGIGNLEAEKMLIKAAARSPSKQRDEDSIKECDNERRSSYPVQMARNRSETSKQSSKSDFSDVWKRQERQHWMRVVEEDGPAEFAVASEAAKKAALTPEEEKAKSAKREHIAQHPHETMIVTARDVVPQKKKKKNRSRAIFGRRKGYMTYEEEEYIEHSPVRMAGNAFAEV